MNFDAFLEFVSEENLEFILMQLKVRIETLESNQKEIKAIDKFIEKFKEFLNLNQKGKDLIKSMIGYPIYMGTEALNLKSKIKNLFEDEEVKKSIKSLEDLRDSLK